MRILSKDPGIYQSNCFGPGVLLAFSGREFGAARRGEYLKRLGVKSGGLVLMKQRHTADLCVLDKKDGVPSRVVADGMITDQLNLALGVRTADCVPVFYWDSRKKVIAAAHAGWRGLYEGIAGKVVRVMKERFGSRAEHVHVALGPAIRACCYEVGCEFKDLFPDFYLPSGDTGKASEDGDRGRMDLIGAVVRQLVNEGVRQELISDAGICTVCRNNLFFSARREKTAERILSLMMIAG